MTNDFNQQVIDEFRANGGVVGGWFEGARLLLLTTIGARSGKPHTTPLGYLPDGGERVLVLGSAGGAQHHPDWFHNVLANPEVTVEADTFTYRANATVLNGAERDELFARAAQADPGWAEYQAKTTRVIPVVALAVQGPPPGGSLGTILKGVHDAFRKELSLIRKEIADSGAGIGAQLRVNCLTLCQGLHNHHTGEDAAIFPHLAGRWPELRPTIDRLGEEHLALAALLDELRALLDSGGTEGLLAEFDQLAGQLEAHLSYEEQHLLPVLEIAG